MLNLSTDSGSRDCTGRARREFLQVGSLGLAGLSLPCLLRAQARAAEAGIALRDTSVVCLFLTGGPSQIETFDPKMTAPDGYRSVTGELSTSIPGVTFGGTFPGLARHAERMAIIRSFTHDTADHTKAAEKVIRGGNSAGAGLGSIAARLRGMTHPESGMPTHIYLSSEEIDRQFNKEKQRLLTADGAGTLGAAYAPFEPSSGGQVNRDMELKIPRARLDDRRLLRTALDRYRRRLDKSGAQDDLDKYEQQAFDLILGKSRDAFDLSQEDPKLVRRYDTSRYMTGLTKHRPSTLGKQLLLARRLCEAGCGFVTVHNPGWDMHSGPTQMNMERGMEELGRPVDHAVSAFLDDIHDRGLDRKILLIITGEFGRTPQVNKNAGRDHWPKLSTLAFAGGGLRMGQIVGRSTAKAEAPLSNPIGVGQLLATVFHVLFDVLALRLQPEIPRDIARAIEGSRPIRELI